MKRLPTCLESSSEPCSVCGAMLGAGCSNGWSPVMESRSRTDDLAMTLVEEALRLPEEERELYLREACGSDLKLFAEAWSYVQWEKRMQRFLLDPVPPPPESKAPFEPGQILIDRFLVIREVAQGGMGIVWEAIDQKLDRRVALKCAKTGFGNLLSPEV